MSDLPPEIEQDESEQPVAEADLSDTPIAENDISSGESRNNSLEQSLQELDQESWFAAKAFSKYAGDISSLFMSTIRMVQVENYNRKNSQNEAEVSTGFKSGSFLCKTSPTVRLALLRAATSLYGENTETEESHIAKLTCEEITTVFALLFLFRRAKRVVDQEEWERVEQNICLHMELGGLIGSTFEQVGRGNGILICGARYLAYSLLSCHKLASFQKYRRAIKNKDKLFDPNLEFSTFGCTHLQLASELLRRLGFIQPYSQASVMLGLAGTRVQPQNIPEAVQDMYVSWHMTLEYTELIQATGKLELKYDKEHPMYVPDEEIEKLNKEAKAIISKGSGCRWFIKVDDE